MARRIKSVHFRRVVRPLKIPFSTALGRKAVINNVLVKVRLDDGTAGTGEVPTSFSAPHETVAVIKHVVREAAGDLVQSPIDLYPEKIDDFRRRFPGARMTISGLEAALFRTHLASAGTGESEYWGGSNRRVESDITVPFSADHLATSRWVRRAVRSGFCLFKLKTSGDLPRDLTFIGQVQSVLRDGPAGFALRLDGNQGFTKESLLELTDMLERRGIAIDLLEQPLPKDDLDGLAYVRERVSMPIILDESVFSVESMRRALDSGACAGVNIKVAKSGISESRRMIEIAHREGLRLMVGCMMETMTGLSGAVRMACGTGAFDFVDLDSVYFLHHRNRFEDITIEAPYFRIE